MFFLFNKTFAFFTGFEEEAQDTGSSCSGRNTPPSLFTTTDLDDDKDNDTGNKTKEKKGKGKRAGNSESQGSIQERFLELQKEQIANQKAQEERQQNFFEKFLQEQRRMEAEERNKDRQFFLQLSALLKD